MIEIYLFAGTVLVAVVSYFAKNFVLTPLVEFNRVRGRVHGQLKYYANVYGGDVSQELQDEAMEATRRLSCDLDEAYMAIGCRRVLTLIRTIPGQEAIEEATRQLIGLSNSTGRVERSEKLWDMPDAIRDKLKIQPKENR